MLVKMLRILVFVLAVLFLAATAGAFLYLNTSPPLEDREPVLWEIVEGESAASVGFRLEEAGLIRSRLSWDLICRLKPEYIKAGFYDLFLPLSPMELHTLFVAGQQKLIRLTVPEGVTLSRIGELLEEAGICGAGDFRSAASDPRVLESRLIPGSTMEGYLYPDTYFFTRNYPAEAVIRTMTDNFFAHLTEIFPDAVNLSPRELNDRVILASIVEREYRVNEEAALMAGVFYNRLRIGMALQSCATVEYVITEIQGRPPPEVLYRRDTEIQDPYNTYVRPGLPPGPISAPGAVALGAVFNPTLSDYLFFRLVDPDAGRHYFSRTLDDHIRAETLYLKRRGG
jgi:UPF0755 protein